MSISNAPAPVIPAVDREAVVAELSRDRLVRSFRGLDIYAVHAAGAPNVMREVGRIREVEFRRGGGGTGKEADIDSFDLSDPGFMQLVAWDPETSEIVAMYRYAFLESLVSAGISSPTLKLFEPRDGFENDLLPYTIELGRSVVNSSAKRALRGLHAVWGGLGAMVAELPTMRYFFGKVTMYPTFDAQARAAIYSVLETYFPPQKSYLRPRPEYAFEETSSAEGFEPAGDSLRADWARLIDFVKTRGETIPPLFVSYTELSDTMQVFGSAVNGHFGDVIETAVAVRIPDIKKRIKGIFVESHTNLGNKALIAGRS